MALCKAASLAHPCPAPAASPQLSPKQARHNGEAPSPAVLAAVERDLSNLSSKKPRLPWNASARGGGGGAKPAAAKQQQKQKQQGGQKQKSQGGR